MENSLKNFLIALCYFVLLSLLWNIYRISAMYLYDVPEFFEQLRILVLFPLTEGFIPLYLPLITAVLATRFSFVKSIIGGVLFGVIWIGYLFTTFDSESFGYTIFAIPGFIIYLFAGSAGGYVYKKAVEHSQATIFLLIPVLILSSLTFFNFYQGSSASGGECDMAWNSTTNTTKHIDCYYAAALQSNDYSLCFNIGQWANNIEEKCIVAVFEKLTQVNTLDSSYCNLPLQTQPQYPSGPNKENYIKSMCLYGVGVATKNNLVCQQINNNGYAKQNCERQVLKK